MDYNKKHVSVTVCTDFIPALTDQNKREICASESDVDTLGQAAAIKYHQERKGIRKVFYYLGAEMIDNKKNFGMLQNFLCIAIDQFLTTKQKDSDWVKESARTLNVSCRELAEKCGIDTSNKQKIYSYRQVLEKLRLFCASFYCLQIEGSGTRKGYSTIHLADKCQDVWVDGENYIRIVFDLVFITDVIYALPTNFLPLALYRIQHRHINSKNILFLFSKHWHTLPNHSKMQSDKELYAKLQVKTLLAVTDLPKFSDLTEAQKARWKNYIKDNFEDALNYLTDNRVLADSTGCSPIKTWNYVVWEPGEWEDEAGVKRQGKDRYIKPSELKKYSYAEWSRLNIKITSDAFVPHENYLQHAQQKKDDYVRSKIIAAKKSGKRKASKRKPAAPDPGPMKTEEDILVSIANSQKIKKSSQTS